VYQLPPEDQQTLETDAAQELANTPSVDYGGACGCTKEAPCCCLPPGYLDAKNKEKSGSGTIVMIGADFTPLSGGVGGSVAGTSGSLKAGGK
ncbi:MAG TPA: hypothetical protein PL037_10250, partial [Elusimicrobiales bacterium]|nr:hypothetical protein [Elusimicrobiales bacterium]